MYRTGSRLLARTQPLDINAAFKSGDANALSSFRDGPWRDPSLTMLGTTQESWLAHALRANARTTTWQLVGMGTIIGRTVMPHEIIDWLEPGTKKSTVNRYRDGIRAAAQGRPMWMDRWMSHLCAGWAVRRLLSCRLSR